MTSAYDDRSRRELTERKAVEEVLRREPVEARDRVLSQPRFCWISACIMPRMPAPP